MSRQGLSPAEAAQTILDGVRPLESERVSLLAALHRVLAEPVHSPLDIPPWDNSAMDGYAARRGDLQERGTLRIIETIPAGQFPAKRVGPGECSRIFTGAPVPEGADSVIRQEDTTVLPGAEVRINDLRDAGRNVRARGEDLRKGARVFEPGVTLGPAQLGVLASMAMPEVTVVRRPRVAILGSGDEIAELHESAEILSGRKIASSNSYTLSALLEENGAEVINLGIARDHPAHLRERLAGARDTDVLITNAGVSVGEHDHVRAVLDDMGLALSFWRIRMRPGAPVGYGIMSGGRRWLGLPGNPVSAMVTFELFGRPLLRRLAGHAGPFRRTVAVRVAEDFTLGPRLQHFQRVIVEERGGVLEARLTGPQGSGILTSMARANALLIVPESKSDVAAGETLQALLLDETRHVAEPPW